MINIGILISKNYKESIPNLDNFFIALNEKNINLNMIRIASSEKAFRMKAFQEKRFINLLADAGSVLGFKCVHAVIAHPGVNDALPLDVYENHDFTQKDYMIFFSDMIEKIYSNNMQIASVIIDQLPAQINGINLCIASSDDHMTKSII